MRITSEYNLERLYVELSKEWHPTKNGGLVPSQVTPGSGKKVWWLCRQGHEWKTTVHHRTNGTGCPRCYEENRGELFRRAVLQKRGSLAETNPKMIKQWHPTKNKALTPYDVTSGSNRKVWWKCDQGHEWEASLNNRTRGKGCPFCSGRRTEKVKV